MNIVINNSSFDNNTATYGGVISCDRSNITVRNSSFTGNSAHSGGGVSLIRNGSITTFKDNCVFNMNSARSGAVVFIDGSSVKLLNSKCGLNSAHSDGGVTHLNSGNISVIKCSFTNNSAANNGGVLSVGTCTFTKTWLLFSNNAVHSNKAHNGGGVISIATAGILNIILSDSIFTNNSALDGGILYALHRSEPIMISNNTFSRNQAKRDGGVIYSENQAFLMKNNSFSQNKANAKGGVFCLVSNSLLNFDSGSNFMMENEAHSGGVIYADHSNVTNVADGHQNSHLLLLKNTASTTGGSISIFTSSLILFDGNITLNHNHAQNGGAIYAESSQIRSKNRKITRICDNIASVNGGGFYIHLSKFQLSSETNTKLCNNIARKGGGFHASNSSVSIDGLLQITNNSAEFGGGGSLKSYPQINHGNDEFHSAAVYFVLNSATLDGGAIYIDDYGMCTAIHSHEGVAHYPKCFSVSNFFYFSHNNAGHSGSDIFGGLLDRCLGNSTTDAYHESLEDSVHPGVARFHSLSNITNVETVDSDPVKLCICRNSRPDCKYNPSLQINYGETVRVQVIAYNQVDRAVSTTIMSSLKSSAGGLGNGQDKQVTNETCTELSFNIFSPFDSDELLLKADGPCQNSTSQRIIKFEITCVCPIGFQRSYSTRCQCECDSMLKQYGISQCNYTQESIIRTSNVWISYVNHSNSTGYLIYSNCPSGYCLPPSSQISINLNIPGECDKQCAPNRTGILCGSCKPGFSVSLSSSRCVACQSDWPGFLVVYIIVFILVGIGLVVLLLVLNLTVAIGTLNAILFYANIIAITRNAFFFTSNVSFASVFISWLNLDAGFDFCLFSGMDTFIKTWFELLFPAYIFLLVILVIKLSYHFTVCGHLIGRKDPVATLATLILLSYTKLLNIIVTAFSSFTLKFPNSSTKSLWLPDGTIEYLSGKHAALFSIALLILILGIIYTILILSWHWIPYNPRWKVAKWNDSLKFWLFLDTYYAPYIKKHRYWTGLLLLVRLSINLVSVFDVNSNPRKQLLSTIIIICCLLFIKAVLAARIYKAWITDAMETLTYLNLIILSVIILYTFDTNGRQEDIIKVSVGITITQLLLIVCYHSLKYTKLSKILGVVKRIKWMRKHFNEDLVEFVRESEPVTLSELTKSEESTSLDDKLTGEACTTDDNVIQDDELLDDNARQEDEMLQRMTTKN